MGRKVMRVLRVASSRKLHFGFFQKKQLQELETETTECDKKIKKAIQKAGPDWLSFNESLEQYNKNDIIKISTQWCDLNVLLKEKMAEERKKRVNELESVTNDIMVPEFSIPKSERHLDYTEFF